MRRASAAAEQRQHLVSRPFAHRGLHGPSVPENSLAAARAAIAAGYGIECDVRLSRDGVAHVFHDVRVERLTNGQGRFDSLDSAAIATLRLHDGAEPPPRLRALLDLLASATPLLIELKSDGTLRGCVRLCRAVAVDLAGRGEPVAVMGFDPRVCSWFARHCPDIPCGLVVSRRFRAGLLARRNFGLVLARIRPHFIACDVRDLPRLAAIRRSATTGALLCWTVRTARDEARARAYADQIIVERPG